MQLSKVYIQSLAIAALSGVASGLAAAAPLAITTAPTLPDAAVGVAYRQTLSATGGTQPYTWKFGLGEFPYFFQLDPSGVLTGTPQASDAGKTYSIRIRVVDATDTQVTQTFTVSVRGAAATPLSITSISPLPDGSAGAPYQYVLQATSGTTPYTWSALSTLPAGLSLGAASGTLSGAVATAGKYTLLVQVSDAAGASAQKSLDLSMTGGGGGGLTITTASPLPNAVSGQLYTQTIAATGGTPPYSWRFPLGEMPGFLVISASSGVLSGTPDARYLGQTLSFRIMVTDAAGATAIKAFQVLVIGNSSLPLTITSDSPLPDAFNGLFYYQVLSGSGGAAPYKWSVSPGSTLPAGLILDPSSGALYGLPSANGTFTFSIRLNDAAGASVARQFRLTVRTSDQVMPAGPVPSVGAPVAVGVDGARGRAYFVNRLHYDVYAVAGGALPTDAVSVLDIKSGKIINAILVGKAQAGDYQGIAVDSARRRIYVPNADDGTVSVIDPVTSGIAATLQVGAGPTGVAVDASSGTVYVANSNDYSISVLDATGASLGTVSLSGKPYSIAVDRSTGRAYALVQAQPWTVIALEGTAKRGELQLPLMLGVRGIAVDPGQCVYVADSNGPVTAIDISAGGLVNAGAFTGGDSPAKLAVDPATHFIYVTNFGSSTVKVFRPDGSLAQSYDVLKGPTAIAIDETGRQAFVADTLADSYSIIDLANQKVANSLPLGTLNAGLAFDRVSKRLYGANLIGNAVSVIDAASKKALTSWPCGDYPWAIAVDPGLQQVYTVNVHENTVSVLSTADGSLQTKLQLPDSRTDAAFIAVNPRTNRVYVTPGDGLSTTLTILDGTVNQIENLVTVGKRPVGIAIDDNAGLVYVANSGAGTISVIDAGAEQVIATWDLGGSSPWGVAVDPNLHQLYVTVPPNTPADFYGMLVLDSRSGALLQQVQLGTNPELILVNPATGHVFVSDPDDSTVTAVDGATLRVLQVTPVGNFALALALDPDRGIVYLANGTDGTINVIPDAR